MGIQINPSNSLERTWLFLTLSTAIITLARTRKNSGYPESESNSDSDERNRISTTTSGFEARAYENGILDPTTSKPPPDLNTIKCHLTQRRTSTQPSERTHERYYREISESHNERRASFLIQSDIMKRYNDPNYNRINSQTITCIPEEDFNKGLSNPHPDLIDGLNTGALPDHMRNHALYNSKSSLSLCHFAA